MKAVLRAGLNLLASLLLAPVLLALAATVLFSTDIAWVFFGKKRLLHHRRPDTRAASVVIPNWNGRDLLEKYLPSVLEATQGSPGNEVIVVDNGSTDGSAAFLAENFPGVRVIALPANLGFGGGSNTGFRAARNDVVVLLNSDMRVSPDFLQPLLDGFGQDDVFAVSCQIFLSDPEKRREETGLTEGWWQQGRLRVSHREDPKVKRAFPCFYAGGGSAAFDRAKFLELGGFDELLRPFYLEDTDMGFLAWKRGWKVLYEPRSIVFHEHRGTIGRKFSTAYIDSVLRKNYLLFAWKNIHGWKALTASFLRAWTGSLVASLGDEQPLRTTVQGIGRAFLQLPGAVASRWRSRGLATVSDTEAFERTRGSHFRDRFRPVASARERLRVLFVSPYPILPPVHGGAVFMSGTLRELCKTADVHVLVLLDEPSQAAANRELARICGSVETMVRPRNRSIASVQPHAVCEFASRDVQWLIDRIAYEQDIDVIQIEYTPMGQYAARYRQIVTALFEHDIYFQSVLRTANYMESSLARAKAYFEYLRALRFELALLRRCDQVQVCTKENQAYLLELDPRLRDRVQPGLRAAIETCSYQYPGGPRDANALLFIGSSRHSPNKQAMEWFAEHVWPRILSRRPHSRIYLAGFEPGANPRLTGVPGIEMMGHVADVKPLLSSCAVFVCPILFGSGVRVKLLEAFASGIPVVSTTVGAEGLTELCVNADAPDEFAARTLELLEDPARAQELVARANEAVRADWDTAKVTKRLEASYWKVLLEKGNRDRCNSTDSRPPRREISRA